MGERFRMLQSLYGSRGFYILKVYHTMGILYLVNSFINIIARFEVGGWLNG